MNQKIQNLLMLALCIYAGAVLSQTRVSNEKMLPKAKMGTTYILMKDTANPATTVYKEIFKKCWTFSKFKFINTADQPKYITPESSFFYFENLLSSPSNYDGSVNMVYSSFKTIYLTMYNDDYFKAIKKGKKVPPESECTLGTIELHCVPFVSSQNIADSMYTGGTGIRNWGPGMFKNQLQQLVFYLNKGINKEAGAAVEEKEKIKGLKKQTLYVPDYVLIKYNAFNGSESRREEKDVFEDYEYPYKLISIKELNDKIINDKEPFYYLNYVRNSAQKYVAIVDSETGQVIYMDWSPAGYNLKRGDLRDLAHVIKKANK
jgi:hypothetical protein